MKKIFAFILIFFYQNIVSAQNFLNGDLEGFVNGYSSLPDGWQNIPIGDPNCLSTQNGNVTPDLTSLYMPDSAIGVNGNPYHGYTFVSGLFVGNTFAFTQEGIMQLVFGFTIGKKYLIHLRQTVVKNLFCQDKSGSWAVYVDTIFAGITIPTYSNEPFKSVNLIWEARSVNFTATSTSHIIKFLPMDDDSNYSVSTTDTMGALYMGIDSIGLDVITGINEVNVSSGFNIFPIPSKGSFIIKHNSYLNHQTTLIINNAFGQMVDEITIVNETTNYQNTSLTNGLYFYTIRNNEEELQRGKFLIVK
jgi:hypothetical protein